MEWLLGAIGLLAISGFSAIVVGRSARLSARLGAIGGVSACLVAAIPTVRALAGGDDLSFRFAWDVPVGSFVVGLDALSAFFLLPVLVLSALAAVYGGEYMQAYGGDRSLGGPMFSFNLLVAGMLLVLIARNGIVFMLAWELMSLSAYFLVTFEHDRADVRRAGWVYLVATHLGAAFLFALFTLLGRAAGDLDFEGFHETASLGAGWPAALFLLALVGFGAKAGFVPYHVWLPEAHPAAPSHVSAIMSGVMIKLGVYGILRVMTFLGPPAAWWGPTLTMIGLTGGLIGVSLAFSQRDLKRALAYSSIENIGLITVGVGVGVWGVSSGHPTMAVLGFAGGLLHVWNHALMKGLMFLAAGSVLHGTSTKDMERLGGLLKVMPRTGSAMIMGAVAIAGLPPLNGFVSEWLLYMGLMRGGLSHEGVSRAVLLLSVGVVALIGGLAIACFVRLVGTALLGEPRSDTARHAHESDRPMTVPLVVLAAACAAMAVLPNAVIPALSRVSELVLRLSRNDFHGVLSSAESPLAALAALNVAVWVAIGLVAVALVRLRRLQPETGDSTWGCGYAAPTARMQYTSTSLSELLAERVFPRFLRARVHTARPSGLFPAEASFASDRPDPLSERVYEPFFARWAERLARLRWVQRGKVHGYLIYIFVVVVASFAWVSVRGWVVK